MRLEITKKTDLAARALVLLAAHGVSGESLKGPQLADELGTSTTYLPQVMKPLVSRGWVVSNPGPTGGYRPTGHAESVSMLELIEAVEGTVDTSRCVLRSAPCPAVDACGLHNAWSRARTALIDELRRTPVVDGAVPVRAGHRNQKGDNQ